MVDMKRVKIGLYNGVDVYFCERDGKFTASFFGKVISSETYKTMKSRIDDESVHAALSSPADVVFMDMNRDRNPYRQGRTTGNIRTLDGVDEVEVALDGHLEWLNRDDLFIASDKTVRDLNDEYTNLYNTEERYRKLRKKLSSVSVSQTERKKKLRLTATPIIAEEDLAD